MSYEILIQHITHFRKHAQITQLYLAHKLGSSDEDYYGKIERCQKELKLHCLKKISHELCLSPIILLCISGYTCFTPPKKIPSSTPLQENKISMPIQEIDYALLLNKICVVHHDLHAAHFYQRVYKGIRTLRHIHQINSKQLSRHMNYSMNHFARMERENCEITLKQAFVICEVLNISFVKLLLFANSLDFFTDSKGVFISLSELKKRYPAFEICLKSL